MLAMAVHQPTWMLDMLASSRASSLPQEIFSGSGISICHRSNCGSELARDGGVSAHMDVGCAGLIASKLALTGDFQWIRNLNLSPIKLWERACSRWRCISPHGCWMCWPHCEQARSHMGCCQPPVSAVTTSAALLSSSATGSAPSVLNTSSWLPPSAMAAFSASEGWR